jgi:membrane-associated phospholipid phosphatase
MGSRRAGLCPAAAVWWLYCRGITAVAATVLPHLMKHLFWQERPDRWSFQAHIHGAPFSSRPLHSFPSNAGCGGLGLPRSQRLVWVQVVLTRVLLLAHWVSDVVAGLAVGAALERIVRRLTVYRRPRAAS